MNQLPPPRLWGMRRAHGGRALLAWALAATTSCGAATGPTRQPPQVVTHGSSSANEHPAVAPPPPTVDVPKTPAADTTEPWSVGMSDTAPNRFVEQRGVRFAYRVFGRKPGVPLLFLAPFRGTMDSWDPQVTDGFAQGRPVILFDNVGVGLSTGDTPTTVADMAHDAETFIDALRELHFTDSDWRTGHVDLLGFGLGGYVAQQLALTRPDVVERVVLAGTAPRGGDGIEAALPEVAKKLSADRQTLDDALFLLFARSDASQAAGRAFLTRVDGRKAGRDEPIAAKTIRAELAAIKGWGAAPRTKPDSYLSRIKQPVLVAAGDADIVMPPSNSRALARNVPNARLVVYPDSGNGFLFQYPDTFVREVSTFLQRP